MSEPTTTVRVFKPGDRVTTHGYAGTVRDVLRQVNADDLYIVDWDLEPDHELYHGAVLRPEGSGKEVDDRG